MEPHVNEKRIDFSAIHFLKSAPSIKECPPDDGREVAFVGRSNAGKSSALNVIVGSKLARTSKLPGRTQLINYFVADDAHRFVDLPGYGYAEVPEDVKLRWQKELERYLRERQSLVGLVLLTDIRRPLQKLDAAMLEWALASNLPVHILLTKADKLSRGASINTLRQLESQLKNYSGTITSQLFSALKKIGVDEARQQLNHWLTSEHQ